MSLSPRSRLIVLIATMSCLAAVDRPRRFIASKRRAFEDEVDLEIAVTPSAKM